MRGAHHVELVADGMQVDLTRAVWQVGLWELGLGGWAGKKGRGRGVKSELYVICMCALALLNL